MDSIQLPLCLETKRCMDCDEVKPFSAFYLHKRRHCADTYYPRCRVCHCAMLIQKRDALRESDPATFAEKQRQRADYNRGYRATESAQESRVRRTAMNREKINANHRDFYDRTREERRREARERYQSDPERFREEKRLDYTQRGDQVRERNRKYAVEHPDIFTAAAQRRRARKEGNGGSYTVAEWQAIKAAQDYTCLMCGKREPEIKLTVDHVVPIALGGSNDADNLQGLCRSCNCRKRTRIIDFRKKG